MQKQPEAEDKGPCT